MASSVRIVSVEPSVFFVREGETLRQVVRLALENEGDEREFYLGVRAEGLEELRPLGSVGAGRVVSEVSFPDIRCPTEVHLSLWTAGVLQDEARIPWKPEKHWEVYLVHYAHHDLGYTDLPDKVLAEYDGFMDQVLRYCQETEDWPEEEAKFRYLCEQSWSVVHFVEHRPPEVVERLAHFIRNGQIEVSVLFANEIQELCGHEELIRLLYPSFRLKRELGIELASAEHNDIPGFSWGLASVLAGAGIRYFSPGVPLWYFGRGEEQVHPLWDTAEALPLTMPAACWWEGPDGARVLLWSDLHGNEWQPYDLQQALSELPGMLRDLERQGYPYDMVSYTLRGGHRDNAPPTLRYAHLVREWNRRWAYPRLINATNALFLRAFERRWGNTLKTLRGDVPGTDYCAAATCTPKETALNRNTHDGLLTAEKLAAIASLLAGYEYPQAILDEAYRQALYYDEHCWGMAHPGGPAQDGSWSEKGGFAYKAAALTHDIIVKASNRLAERVAYPEEGYYLTVFNPLAQERSEIVRAPLHPWQPCSSPMFWKEPDAETPWPLWLSGGAVGRRLVVPPSSFLERPFELWDVATGRRMPYQVARLSDPQAAQPWAAERVALGKVDPSHLYDLVFLAEGIPAMGYKTYRIVPCKEWPEFASDSMAINETVENRFFRLRWDPQSGTLLSLWDKELDRELIDRAARHGLGQMIVRSSESGEEETLRITGISVNEAGPVYTTLSFKGEASCCPRVSGEITLYHALKRVDFAARILRDSTPMRELYFAFPFAVEAPQFRFEAPNAVIEPLRDQWPGSNTDYYAVQHWADVFNRDWGIVWAPLDAPMVEFGGLWPGYVSGAHHGVRPPGYGHPFLRPGELKRGHLYSLVSYNNFRTNFVNIHPGEFLVRYAFSAHQGDWREGRARGFGWSVANPPVTVWMKGPRPGDWPPTASFCQVQPENVLLLTFKRAEDSRGYILRLLEAEGEEVEAVVILPRFSLLEAYETNLVEEDRHSLPCSGRAVRVALRPFSLATIRLIPSDREEEST